MVSEINSGFEDGEKYHPAPADEEELSIDASDIPETDDLLRILDDIIDEKLTDDEIANDKEEK